MQDLQIKERLEQIIKEHDTNWSKLATDIGFTPQASTKWKKGQISTDTVKKIGSHLGVDLVWLLTGMNSNNGLYINGNNTNHGTQIGSQNNYSLNQNVQAEASQQQLDEYASMHLASMHLKDMPLLDIDDGVKFAMYPEAMLEKIQDTAERASTFIPHSGRTFGIKNAYDIHGVSPSVIAKNDILIIEPAIAPRANDLVLLCVDYQGLKRGVIARLESSLAGNLTVKYSEKEAENIPENSIICGVVIEIKRRLLDNALLKSRLNPEWDIFSTVQQ